MTSNVNAEKTVLVINCGSSSLKFAIINPDDGHVFLNGIAEKLGLSDARIEWRFEGLDKEKINRLANETADLIREKIGAVS